VPARLIEGGLPTEASVAQVLVSKYADHLPYVRNSDDCDQSFQRIATGVTRVRDVAVGC
jgi:transposase